MVKRYYIAEGVYNVQKKIKPPKVPKNHGLLKFIEQLSLAYGSGQEAFKKNEKLNPLTGDIEVKL